MAAIGKIREHGVLVMIIIGVAMLAFILNDLGKSGRSRENNVAVVNGEKITYQDYFRNSERIRTSISEATPMISVPRVCVL